MQQLDCLAGDAVGVDPAGPPAHLGVGAEEGGDVAEVGGALEGAGAGLDRLGVDTGRLQLVEQPYEGAGEAGPRGRSSQRAEPRQPSIDRDRDRPQPLGGGELGARRHPARGGDGAEQRPEGHRRAAQRRPRRAELALEGEDVVDGGHDQNRIALERGHEPAPDESGTTRVRGSVDQLQRHSGKRPSIGPASGAPESGRRPRHKAAKRGFPAPVLPSTAPSRLRTSPCPSVS